MDQNKEGSLAGKVVEYRKQRSSCSYHQMGASHRVQGNRDQTWSTQGHMIHRGTSSCRQLIGWKRRRERPAEGQQRAVDTVAAGIVAEELGIAVWVLDIVELDIAVWEPDTAVWGLDIAELGIAEGQRIGVQPVYWIA